MLAASMDQMTWLMVAASMNQMAWLMMAANKNQLTWFMFAASINEIKLNLQYQVSLSKYRIVGLKGWY